MALFESYNRRIAKINEALSENGISSIEEAKEICAAKGIDPYSICKDVQPIAFENDKDGIQNKNFQKMTTIVLLILIK